MAAIINMDSTETQIRLYSYHFIAANTNMDNTAVTIWLIEKYALTFMMMFWIQ